MAGCGAQLEVYENQQLDSVCGWVSSQLGAPTEPLCWSSATLEHTCEAFPIVQLPVSWHWLDDQWKVRPLVE